MYYVLGMESRRKKKLRNWSEEAMSSAYIAVKGGLSISAAAKRFNVPRMTLSDRISGRVKLKSKMGVKTALSSEEESALCNYITYMANRGFPLTIQQILGFAWCIAKEHGKRVFTKNGPSRNWWRFFKKRHPELKLRRPDALDRGRAALGNVGALRDYFKLLKETIESNKLEDSPERIYNCDEAALYLNKSAGQRVIVPARMRHSHSVSIATNEHVSVHCCVNAAGHAIPPMLIFSKNLPGGAYHRNGPINASYGSSESGFMDQKMYELWFEKTFLAHAVPERPLLLIQDGASAHLSINLIRSAIENNVILLCLPPKTTHITQPLDVAVYRKMKLETTKVISQLKMLKSDAWVGKNKISSVFKTIFERSFTMDCIIQGFRKCGIHPFNPNAIDKSLLLRSNTDVVDPETVDLSVEEMPDDKVEVSRGVDNLESMNDLAIQQNEEQVTRDIDEEVQSEEQFPLELNFVVGDDGILTIDPTSPMASESVSTELDSPRECPPDLGLAAIENTLTPRKKRRFHELYEFKIEHNDPTYIAWRNLKNKLPIPDDGPAAPPTTKAVAENPINPEPTTSHPLVRAGLIPDDLADVLVVPSPSTSTKKRKESKKARVLTSTEVQKELELKEEEKRVEEENKRKRKIEREEKRKQKELDRQKKQKEMEIKKEIREKKKAQQLIEKQTKRKNKELNTNMTTNTK